MFCVFSGIYASPAAVGGEESFTESECELPINELLSVCGWDDGFFWKAPPRAKDKGEKEEEGGGKCTQNILGP